MHRSLLLLALGAVVVFAGCGGDSTPLRDIADVEILHGKDAEHHSAGKVPDYVPTGELIADSGFRPPEHGFNFENYGDEKQLTELTPLEVEELFGSQVCASGTGSTCKLTPPAEAWLEVERDAARAGHCFGLAITAARLYSGELDPDAFGADPAADIGLSDNRPLQRTISQTNALQELPSVRDEAVAGTPNEILDRLIEDLREPAFNALAVFHPDGGTGHAVTPYAVEDRGHGRYAVLVYDNNFPGVTRAISFDRHANAWKFIAQTNPDDPEQVYSGHGHESNLALFPADIGHGHLDCPFCRSARKLPKSEQFNEIALEGDPTNHAHLLITDEQGRHTGYVGSRFVNEIPGVEVEQRLANQSWKIDEEPVYLVPVGVKIDVLVDGKNMKRPDEEHLMFIGPGDDVAIRGIELRPGEKFEAEFEGDGMGVSITTDPNHAEGPFVQVGQAPYVSIGVEQPKASWDFSVHPHRLAGGATLNLHLDQEHEEFDIDTHGTMERGEYDIRFARITEEGTETYSHPDLPLPANATARLEYGMFKHHGQPLPLEVHEDGEHVHTLHPVG